MKAVEARRGRMLEMLRERSSIPVDELAAEFHVTATSIRRDLTLLEERGYITRSYGVAHIAQESGIVSLNVRSGLHHEEKERIAAAALRFVHNGAAVAFDSGTTTLALADRLIEEDLNGLTLLTSSIPIATTVAPYHQVIMSGGIVQADDLSLVGPESESYYQDVTSDVAFLGASGVRDAVGLTASSPFLCGIKKQIIASTRFTVALVDSSKFTTNGVSLFCRFDRQEVDALITVRTPENAAQLEQIQALGIEVISADREAP